MHRAMSLSGEMANVCHPVYLISPQSAPSRLSNRPSQMRDTCADSSLASVPNYSPESP